MRSWSIIMFACVLSYACAEAEGKRAPAQPAPQECVCEPSTQDCAPAPSSPTDQADDSDAASAAPNTEAPISRLKGHYGHFDVVAYEDGDTHTLIITWGFTDLYLEGDALYAQEIFCHAEQSTNQPATSDVPDSFTRAILPVPAPVAYRVDAQGKFVLWRTETPTPIGVKLADPAREHLPTDPKDPRFFDADGDGKPGVTVHLNLSGAIDIDLYLARREIFAYEVTEQADKSLRGRVYDHSEQLILGSSNPLFSPAGQWLQHVDLEKSPIILVPVAADMECDALVAARDALFGPVPAVW